MPFTDFSSFYRKAERLSSAIFLISNNIENSPELRTKLTNLSIDFITLCASLRDDSLRSKTFSTSQVEVLLMELTSLIDMASIAHLVSEMNAKILKQEFEMFIKNMLDLKKDNVLGFNLTDSFFNIGGQFLPQLNQEGSINYENNVPKIAEKGVINDLSVKIRNNRKEHREKAIIDLIKSKGDVNIKDISKSIKGCSEKNSPENAYFSYKNRCNKEGG